MDGNAATMELRAATREDAAVIYAWATDAGTRAASFDSAPLDWSKHVSWLESVLQDPNRVLWIGMVDGEPVGSIRFDISGGRANVSIQIAPEHRGQGLGTALMTHGSRLLSGTGVPIDAHIKADNVESIAACLRAGYKPAPSEDVAVVHLIYDAAAQ